MSRTSLTNASLSDVLTSSRALQGWQINFLFEGLRKKWGWDESATLANPPGGSQHHPSQSHIHSQQQQQQQQQHSVPSSSNGPSSMMQQQQQSSYQPSNNGLTPFSGPPLSSGSYTTSTGSSMAGTIPAPQPVRRLMQNPMYAGADFNLAQHPYQSHYVPPISQHGQHNPSFWSLGFG